MGILFTLQQGDIMPTINLKNFANVFLNGVECKEVFFNGAKVWTKSTIDTSVTTINISGTAITSDGKNAFAIKLNYSGTHPSSVIINWGDGSETLVTSYSSVIYHSYAQNKPYTIIISCSKDGYYYIDHFDTFTSIFASCVSSIILGDDINQMVGFGSSSSRHCPNLEYIYIGKNIPQIPGVCFQGLTNLRVVDIDKDSALTTLGYSAFPSTGITKIWFPATLQTVRTYSSYGFSPFAGCSPNLKIYLAGTVKSGFQTYWNYYSSSGQLTYYENISYEEYKNL